MKHLKKSAWIVAATAVMLFSLLSPKWVFWPAAFAAPACIILLMQRFPLGRAFYYGAITLVCSTAVANYKVMPFPTPFFAIMCVQLGVIGTVPYLLNRWLGNKITGWVSTLLFPSAAVSLEYATSFLGGGTWGSIAYSQMDNSLLIQLASLTGIWGVSFVIYWSSSLIVWMINNNHTSSAIVRPLTVYFTIVGAILLFGTFRTTEYFQTDNSSIRMSGITGLNVSVLGTVYQNAFGKTIDFDPEALTQASPELDELNKGLIKFVEKPFDPAFAESQKALSDFQDQMFHIADREAAGGSKVIVFSEALMFTFKPIEDSLINKGRRFAKKRNVTLVLTMGSFLPGKIEFGAKYIENKAVMIDSSGAVVHTFLKNKPVPLVEGSVAGDGSIPIYETGTTKLATSICYDADFPSLMRKAGKDNADILILPSGDWREVSPYHANMARMRAIENGFSLFRPVSGATSLATDSYGRVLASRNFYGDAEKVLVAYLPRNGTTTLYALVGDFFPWICIVAIVAVTVVFTVPRKYIHLVALRRALH
jgi:apolipoprotein N-acyltransferase